MSTLFRFVVIAALFLTCLRNVCADSKNNKNNELDIANKTFRALDKVESGLSAALSWTKSHRQYVKTAAGYILLMYGGQFANTMLFVHALSVSGMPTLIKSFRELAKTYQDTKEVLKQELPDILKAKDEVGEITEKISQFQSQLQEAKNDLDSGKLTKSEFEAKVKASQVAVAELKSSLQKINAIGNFFSHLKTVINPVHLQEIVGAIYQTAIMGIAAVTSQTVATLTMGLNMGKIAFDRGFKAFQGIAAIHHTPGLDAASTFINTHPDWVQTTGKFVSRSIGVLIAFVMNRAAHVFSACSIGSNMIVEAAQEILDPLLEKLELPTLKSTPQGAALLHTALLSLGFLQQFKPGGGGLPGFLKLILAPAIAFEFFLSQLVMKKSMF